MGKNQDVEIRGAHIIGPGGKVVKIDATDFDGLESMQDIISRAISDVAAEDRKREEPVNPSAYVALEMASNHDDQTCDGIFPLMHYVMCYPAQAEVQTWVRRRQATVINGMGDTVTRSMEAGCTYRIMLTHPITGEKMSVAPGREWFDDVEEMFGDMMIQTNFLGAGWIASKFVNLGSERSGWLPTVSSEALSARIPPIGEVSEGVADEATGTRGDLMC